MTDRSVKNIMSPRTQEQLEIIKGEKAHRIGEAALKLFAEKGYEGTSISEIAKEAGVSKGLIYNYFASKEEIVRNLVDQVFTTMWNRFGFDDPKPMTKDRYREFINLSLDIVLEDIDHFRLYFAIFTQPQVLAMVKDDLLARSAPYIQVMIDYYKDQGYDDPIVQMRYAGAIIDGIQMHIMLDPENFPIEEIRKMLIKQLTE